MIKITKKNRFILFAAAILVSVLFHHIVRSADKGPVEIKRGNKNGTIDITSFAEIVAKNPDSVLLVDVRTAEEYESGSLKNAINIPIDELEDRIDLFSADKPIIYICETGERSAEAYDITVLLRDDLQVYYVDTFLSFNEDGTYRIESNEQ